MRYIWDKNGLSLPSFVFGGPLQRPALDPETWRALDDELATALRWASCKVAILLTDEPVEPTTHGVYVIYEPLMRIVIGIAPDADDWSITADDDLWNWPALRRLTEDVRAAGRAPTLPDKLRAVAAAIAKL